MSVKVKLESYWMVSPLPKQFNVPVFQRDQSLLLANTPCPGVEPQDTTNGHPMN